MCSLKNCTNGTLFFTQMVILKKQSWTLARPLSVYSVGGGEPHRINFNTSRVEMIKLQAKHTKEQYISYDSLLWEWQETSVVGLQFTSMTANLSNDWG